MKKKNYDLKFLLGNNQTNNEYNKIKLSLLTDFNIENNQ